MANLDVNRFLTTDDPVEVKLFQQIAGKVGELQETRDQNLAVRIRNEVLEGLGG